MGLRSEHIAALEAEVAKYHLLVERLRQLSKVKDRRVSATAASLLKDA